MESQAFGAEAPSNTIGRDGSLSGPTFAAQPPLFVNALLLK